MVEVSNKRYFVHQDEHGTSVLPSACPHRQGPLHLGKRTTCGTKIVCPWHENKYSVCNLEKRALPSVRSGDTLYIVTSADAVVNTWREKLMVDATGAAREA